MESIPTFDGVLEGRSDGEGEPVLLIHGSVIANTFSPLRSQPALAGFRLITYNRRGFAGSAAHAGPFSLSQQVDDARAVMRHFGIERTHVGGHSYGAAISMQLALEYPDLVQTLTLLEPPAFATPAGEAFVAAAGPVVEQYESGDGPGAVLSFINLVFPEPNWRERIEPHLPAGYWEQAIRDVATMFDVEFPAIGEWQFGDAEAAKVTVPVLSILGEDSSRFFIEGQELMRRWWPSMDEFTLPGASHNLQFANPQGAAEAMAAFLAKHPIGTRATSAVSAA